MIHEMTAIEMAIDLLDRSDKFNIYEKARDEFIDMKAEIASLRNDLDQAETIVTELTDKIETLRAVL